MCKVFDEVHFNVVFLTDPPKLVSGIVNVTKNATDTLTLHCEFTGTPSPVINWIRNGIKLTESRQIQIDYTAKASENGTVTAVSNLTVTNLAKSDEGTYTCVGINGVDNLINAINSSSAFITIQGKIYT